VGLDPNVNKWGSFSLIDEQRRAPTPASVSSGAVTGLERQQKSLP
jgi:hypothetical protein